MNISKIRKNAKKIVADLFQPSLIEVGIYEEPEKLAGLLVSNDLRVKVVKGVLLSDSRDVDEVNDYISSHNIAKKFNLEKVMPIKEGKKK